MDIRNVDRIERASQALQRMRWPAIALGVFLTLALQSVLLRFGFAIAVHDGRVGAGYGLWSLLVVLASLVVGAAITANLSHARDRWHGIAAGVVTWAVALVVGAVSHGAVLGREVTTQSLAWTGFFSALLGLGAAVFGGLVGARTYGSTMTTTQPGAPPPFPAA
ncbi:MAG: hypothetical protein KIT31_42790 [Deltaproteobacteria bacterium]|nr:hypothetical protein [Deltaproteobacteria bacterium]